MKRIFFGVIFLICVNVIHAQDLIVTDKGDSLNCKITNVEKDFIHFTFKYENEIRSTLMPLSQVKNYKKDFYSSPEVPPDKIKNIKGNYQKFRLGIYGGWSYETAKVNEFGHAQLESYQTELKSGYHGGGDITFFTYEHAGAGIKYSMFRTKNELDGIYLYDSTSGQTATGNLKDDITVQFVGLAFTTRFYSGNKKTVFISDFGFGYLSYKDKATVINNFTLTGGTVGYFFDLGIDFSIGKNLALGIGLSYIIGALHEYDYDDGKQKKTIEFEDDNSKRLSRLDLSVGIHWSK